MMQTASKVIIADTNCFILLDKIASMHILSDLFGGVTTTREVRNEFGKQLPEWVRIVIVKNTHQQSILEAEIDKGEASAIALAIETEYSLLILDDLKARKLATKLNLQFTGTLGIFLKAKQSGIIPSVRSVLEKIQQTDFRFSEKTFQEILRTANEA
jgi:predicted nucleic acid-binding protein